PYHKERLGLHLSRSSRWRPPDTRLSHERRFSRFPHRARLQLLHAHFGYGAFRSRNLAGPSHRKPAQIAPPRHDVHGTDGPAACYRSEEHTSELQSRENLVCRLLL